MSFKIAFIVWANTLPISAPNAATDDFAHFAKADDSANKKPFDEPDA
jgi:hypothetical protein